MIVKFEPVFMYGKIRKNDVKQRQLSEYRQLKQIGHKYCIQHQVT